MRVAFYTLGCKLNQCETETLASIYARQGFFVVPWSEKADIFIFNTCTVTSKSEQKARRVIRKARRENPHALICITGCYAQVAGDDLKSSFPYAEIFPIGKKMALADAAWKAADLLKGRKEIGTLDSAFKTTLEEIRESGIRRKTVFLNAVEKDRLRSRPYFKIQDGCNNRCAYCRVPVARGRSKSLNADAAVEGVRELEQNGYGEVVLTGVNISLYRSTGESGSVYRLQDLLEAVLTRTETIRIRLSSIEPDALKPGLLRILGHPRIRPHFHLPIQSGSARILELMNRKYTADQLKEAVYILREIKDNPCISADVIVGFPGENEADFEETETLIRSLRFSQLHVFQFSRRPDTPAFSMKPSDPERIMKNRSRRIRKLSEELYQQYAESCLGSYLETVVEEGGNGTVKRGTTENYLRIEIRGPEVKNLVPGMNCRVKLRFANEFYGELES
jgi:threonylcarbamoyladenosine tRNA methylthiotransferase MtaB